MDRIGRLHHADSSRMEIGIVREFIRLDAVIKRGGTLPDNTLQLVMSTSSWEQYRIREGDYLYYPDTEWGCIVDRIKHSTASRQVVIEGACWRGLFLRKVVEPPSGESHFVIRDMEANDAIRALLGESFGDLVVVDASMVGITVSASIRYRTQLEAIEGMLDAAGLRLYCRYSAQDKRLHVGALPVTDYSERVELSQDYGINMTSTQGRVDRYNHIIALGRGEMQEREVVHLYRLPDGTITQDKPEGWDGISDVVYLYDYPNVESYEDLLNWATKKAKEFAEDSVMEIDTSQVDQTLELGDIVAARDRLTGMAVTATIAEKILLVNEKNVTIQTRTAAASGAE